MTARTGLEKVEAHEFGSLTLREADALEMHEAWMSATTDTERRNLWAEFAQKAFTPEQVQKIAEAAVVLEEAGVR